jgi:hypothetical protein
MIKIDLERARVLLREAMETQGPDFIYRAPGSQASCMNVPDPSAPPGSSRRRTGCLVGTMFTRLRVDLVDLGLAREGVQIVATRLLNEEVACLTDDAITYLQAAQSYQDQGGTWGNAIRHAETQVTQIQSPTT